MSAANHDLDEKAALSLSWWVGEQTDAKSFVPPPSLLGVTCVCPIHTHTYAYK